MGRIGDLIGTLVLWLPPWLVGLIVALTLIAAAPGWLVGLRVKRVKAAIRKSVRADEQGRRALLNEAFELANGRGEVLIALVREADKMNQPALRDRALKALKKLGTHNDMVRKLAAPSNPAQKKVVAHPVEAIVTINRLLEIGAVEAAVERLAEARARFPNDDELRLLQVRVAEGDSGSADEE